MIHSFISELKSSAQFKDQVVHHEIIPPSQAVFSPVTPELPPTLDAALKEAKIRLYKHQVDSLSLARGKKNILITTPTSSGKTLAYTLPVLEEIIASPDTCALFVFPLKALARDQLKTIKEFTGKIAASKITVEVYDGDTSPYFRKKIKNTPPNILITNPDMLHSALLPFHENWEFFFRNLKFIVIDELHTYRGVFGSHVAQIFRRTNRIASFYKSTPLFFASSATISNPEEFSKNITGLDFSIVSQNGAPDPGRHFLFMNPTVSPYTESVHLIRRILKSGLKVITFTKSRKVTELIHSWVIDKEPRLSTRVSSYRSGFLPEERREIEGKLSDGTIQAVISTSALEVGIDIGGLDVCILSGYPGTIINTWQRGGRAGRRQEPGLVILIANHDALDQYFMKNPDDFFRREFEKAILDPFNSYILRDHLPCAAAELPLSHNDPFFPFESIENPVVTLVNSGSLLQSENADVYFSSQRRPHRFVDIRSAGKGYSILDITSKKIIGTISGNKAYAECHPGAIYLHKASQYLVESMDFNTFDIWARKVSVPYFTKPKTEKETEILEIRASKPVQNFIVRRGDLRVTKSFLEYEKRNVSGQMLISTHPLDLPTVIYETTGFWIEIEESIKRMTDQNNLHFMGGIHAMEHCIISLFPLFALCDRSDIGGISIPFHPQVKKGAVFIYDGHPGGVGLTDRGFETIEDLLFSALKLISSCECESGCPSCIHSPKCGSGNKPLDKSAAIYLLELLLNKRSIKEDKTRSGEVRRDTKKAPLPQAKKIEKRVCIFDLETQRSAEEVGGWQNSHLMRMSVGVVYDSLEERYYTYIESETDALIEKLESADLVVGFNIINFDFSVLTPYTHKSFKKLKAFDILLDIKKRLGHRLSLDHLASNTLNAKKSADGLLALKWYKEGKMDLISEYCQKDVEITKNLFEYGGKKGYVLFEKKGLGKARVQVDWKLETIFKEKQNESL